MSNESQVSYELFYLKSRDQVIDAFPDNIKSSQQKIQDELDFYPEKLRPFMGLTLSGKPISWRYKSNGANIFDITLVLQVPGHSDAPAEEVVFSLKDTWFDALDKTHQAVMTAMITSNNAGIVIPDTRPLAGPVSEPEDDDEYYATEEVENYDGFEESAMVYLKTVKDMGISPENFQTGNFTGSQYYPEELRAYAGQVLNVNIEEYFESIDDSDDMERLNHMTFTLAPGVTCTVDIPVEEDKDAENPGVLLFDYKNWISLFADILEAGGPILNELVEAMKYLESMGMKADNTEELCKEVKEHKSEADACCCVPVASKASNSFGEEFLGILMGYKEMGITEKEFYCKTFPMALKYPNEIMHMAGTIVPAVLIDSELAIVTIEGKQWDIPAKFVCSIEGSAGSYTPDKEDDEWSSLAVFDKNNIGHEVLAGKVEDFMFVKYPEVSSRIKARSFSESSANLISLLKGFVNIARLILALVDRGMASDFIIVTDFIKGIASFKLPVDLLDNLMFFQIDSKMELYVVSYEDKVVAGDKVDINFADDTPEDMYLKEFSDEFDNDMNSGSGLRRLVLSQYPTATIVEFRKI